MELVATTNKELENVFLQIISKGEIKTVFQPIVSLRDGSIFGYEALSRGPQGTPLHNPETLFKYAQNLNMLWELEQLCRTKALEAVLYSEKQFQLFMNVNPYIMQDFKFKQGFTKEYLKNYSIDPENLVFEITEKNAITNIFSFKKIVANYKEQNYKIAIDDAGAGYSGLNLISDVHPHFIKLDMNLIRDIDKDATKQSLVRSMCEFAILSNTGIIAEGIETEKELVQLINIGVNYGQGFYIQKPSPLLSPIQPDIIDRIHEANNKKNHIYGSRISDIYINNICTPLRTLNPNMRVEQVDRELDKDSTLPGFCITQDEKLLGVITRNYLHSKLSGQFGYSLYSNKPISDIMSKNFMSVDYRMSIDRVAKIAMQREPDKLYDFITITKDGKYVGIVTVKDLLEKAIQIEIVNAKHINPLSELPGNLLIERHLELCIASKRQYTVLYFDIDDFKSYNDVYGFEKGDIVIKRLTQILKKYIPTKEFVGHIGGDDFIAVLYHNKAEELCQNVIREFDAMVPQIYNENDAIKGFITAKNRHGVEESYPLMSLSIAGITNRDFKNIYELSEKASRLKKICKQKPGSNYMLI